MRRGARKGPLLTCIGCGDVFYAPPCAHRLYCSRACLDANKAFSIDRFWQRVAVGQIGECWPWLAGHDAGDGYGRAFDGERTRPAHALALEICMGRRLRRGLIALHSCDNPPCCNPWHLREGTPADNTQDRIDRGRLTVPYRDYPVPMSRRPTGLRNGMYTCPERRARGARSGMHTAQLCKLTRKQVLQIRRDYARGETLVALAKRFGVGAPQIHRIVNRQRWAWL